MDKQDMRSKLAEELDEAKRKAINEVFDKYTLKELQAMWTNTTYSNWNELDNLLFGFIDKKKEEMGRELRHIVHGMRGE